MNQNISFLIKRCEDVGIKHLNDPKASIEYSQCMDDVTVTLMSTTQQERGKF